MNDESNEMFIGNYIPRCLITYGVTILAVMMTGRMFGEDAKGFSTMYQLGSQGLAYSTLLQLFASSAAMSLIFELKFIKKMMFVWRATIIITSITAIVILFAWIFAWFPMNDPYAWVGFLVSYGSCALLSTGSVLISVKLKKRKYERLLKAYKEDKNNEKKAGEI